MKYDFPIALILAFRHAGMRIGRLIDRVRSTFLLRLWGVKHGRNVVFEGPTIFLTHHRGDITIGNNVVFNSRVKKNLVGLMNPTIISCVNDGYVHIGNNCGFSSVVMASRIGIEIGDYATVGGNVRIFDHDFHEVEAIPRRGGTDGSGIRSAKVIIGDDVFIGTNAIILKGTKIGDRSIIAAGSVVFGLDIPPDSLVKGNPGKIISRKND